MNDRISYYLFFIFLLAPSCGGRNLKSGEKPLTIDYGSIKYAERFELNKTDSCTILTIYDPWQGAGDIRHIYYLIKEGSGLNLKIDSSHIINVPVRRIICMSTTHLAMIKALKEANSIVGVSGSEFIYDKEIYRRISEGLVSDIGYEAGMNNELIIRTRPDIVMMYGIGGETAGYTGKITELGIKVMFNADYLETDPLGKAEWIKMFGALYCREERADTIFSDISVSYEQIKMFIRENADKKPSVLLGLPFRDTWFISPGNSYISRLIKDAGGSYLWEDTESEVSMPFGLENVFMQSLKADYWLNTGAITSKNEILSLDPRLGSIPPFISGNLYNNNRRLSERGGNDYWESGTLNPHIILKDIAAILHPGLFGNYEPVYYRKIE
jgi:iron complex transport system substrate-binding protein